MGKTSRLHRVALAVLVACTCLPSGASARQGSLSDAVDTDAALDLLLTREAQRLLDAHGIKARRPASVTVAVEVDIRKSVLTINFGRGFLSTEEDGSTEEVVQYIENTLGAYANRAGLDEVEVRILYEGKPFEHYFPGMPAAGVAGRAVAAAAGEVLVSAGHGLVRVHPGGEWEFQRPMSHGVQEDLITPGYADELQHLLGERGRLVVHRVRRAGDDLHPESMRGWREMSARYHLKALLPERADIWNHFIGSTASDREVKDDIRARPYYANHLGVEGMISIHTNADDSQLARGARVYYHPRKPNDRELASTVLCYVKEVVTAQEGFGSFPVSAMPAAAAHGENGFAGMPSIIVEVAFHTNAADALALQDPVFRTASMKGVEKGYRLYREGKGCKPLKGEPIEAISMSQGTVREVDVPFEGYPQYPLRVVTRNVGCPPGWVCEGNEVTIEAPQEAPIRIALRCNNNGSAPLFWETSLVDDDGVASAPVRHQQQCLRSS